MYIIHNNKGEIVLDSKIIKKVGFIFLISRFSFLAVGWLYCTVNGVNKTISELFAVWDAGYYWSIIEKGYGWLPNFENLQGQWAFFPLYPMVCRVVYKMFHLTAGAVGMLVSSICILIAMYFSVKYMRLTRKDNDSDLPIILFLLGPYAFYFQSCYTEAMYMMFIILFFYCLKKNWLFRAAVAAALASATRLTGVLLVFPFILHLYYCQYEKISLKKIGTFIVTVFRSPKMLLFILICPSGTFSYMYYLYQKIGDVWAFSNVQIGWRVHNNLIYGLKKLWDGLVGTDGIRFTYTAWIVMLGLVILAVLYKEKRYEEGIFYLLSMLVPMMSGLFSMPRFLMGGYFFIIGFSALVEKLGKYKEVVISVLCCVELVYIYAWMSSFGGLQ